MTAKFFENFQKFFEFSLRYDTVDSCTTDSASQTLPVKQYAPNFVHAAIALDALALALAVASAASASRSCSSAVRSFCESIASTSYTSAGFVASALNLGRTRLDSLSMAPSVG